MSCPGLALRFWLFPAPPAPQLPDGGADQLVGPWHRARPQTVLLPVREARSRGSGSAQACFLPRPWGLLGALGSRLRLHVLRGSLCLAGRGPGMVSGPPAAAPRPPLVAPADPPSWSGHALTFLRRWTWGNAFHPGGGQQAVQRPVPAANQAPGRSWPGRGHSRLVEGVSGARRSAPGLGAPTACPLHGEDPIWGLSLSGSP